MRSSREVKFFLRKIIFTGGLMAAFFSKNKSERFEKNVRFITSTKGKTWLSGKWSGLVLARLKCT